MNTRNRRLAAVLLLVALVLSFGCTVETRIEYRDGYIQIVGAPEAVCTVTIKFRLGDGTYRQTITVSFKDGKSELIPLGQTYRQVYGPGEVEIVVRDCDDKEIATRRNKEPLDLTPPGSPEAPTPLPYDKFGP